MNVRPFRKLSRDRQARFRDYISRNAGVATEELAEDLLLSKATVASVKAHVTRHYEASFNDLLLGPTE